MTSELTASLSTTCLEGGAAISRVQLLPKGRMMAGDGRGPWFLHDPGGVIAASQADLRRGMPVDLDHALERNGEAPAAGWITKLEAAEDGIWGTVEWTPLGRSKIAGREYRYISPVFKHDPSGRIVRIERAGLTNKPALEMQAICEKENEMKAQAPIADTSELLEFVSAMRAALGLSPGATSGEMLNVVKGLLAAPDRGKGEVIEQVASITYNMWMENREKENEARVSAAMRSAKLPPALRDWGLAVCRENPALFDEFVRTTPGFTHLLGRQSYPDQAKLKPSNHVFDQLGLTTDQ